MLAPELAGRDLRISSQTGSGKTVAIGLTLREAITAEAPEEPSDGNEKGKDQRARPRALVVVPTRELAKQVEEELGWLYAPLEATVVSVTGGGGYRDELRAFRAKPAIIVGTPGRLLDHLKRGMLDASTTGSIVLDEADRMLDMGFREDLEAIFAFLPKERSTHLVSATFPREVKALADRLQSNPAIVEGTPIGTANQDIEHLVHLVHPRQRLGAIVNLLLEKSEGQTLIFARTRADVSELTDLLGNEGFAIAMLSGEMEQAERNRALTAFKKGNMDALVATDVAARGIDVSDVTRVIHVDPPSDADAYTHRSGRTGRAGKKGTSSLLVGPGDLGRTSSLLSRARVRWNFAPVPSAADLLRSQDDRLVGTLTAEEGDEIDARSTTLASRIVGDERAIARLIAMALRRSGAEPHEIDHIAPPSPQDARFGRMDRGTIRGQRNERPRRDERPRREDGPRYEAPSRAPREDAPRSQRDDGPRSGGGGGDFVPFHVSWGDSHGADARRLVAMMCRRGGIAGGDIGAIRIGRTSSMIEVSTAAAASFEESATRPDPRDPRVRVRRWSDEPASRQPMNDEPPPAELPAERPSRARIPKDRPSVKITAPTKPAPKKTPWKPKPAAGNGPPKRRTIR